MIFKALIVDDDYINRRLLVSLLKRGLYQVEILEAVNGRDALTVCEHETDIHLILLDIEMPNMDGAEFLKHYIQNKELKKAPIIAVSSNDLRKKEILSLGADAFLMKPVTKEKFFDAIRESQIS